MIPTEIVIRIDVRDLSLIEVEQIAKTRNIPVVIAMLVGRKCWIDLKLEEKQA